jgi:acyl carrier protein
MYTPEQEAAYIEATGEFRKVVGGTLGISVERIPANFGTLVTDCDGSIDMLDLAEIVMDADEHFGVCIDDREFDTLLQGDTSISAQQYLTIIV